MTLHHMTYLIEEKEEITENKKKIKIWKLDECADEEVLNNWAKHLRRNYCSDEMLDLLVKGTTDSKEEFLKKNKLPSAVHSPGPSTRSGDFSEILLADYLEFFRKFYIPRTRYDNKVNPNTSTQGSDVIGLKTGKEFSKDDELIIFEVKAQASRGTPKNRLKDAILDSEKDFERLSFSLSSAKQRMLMERKIDEASIIERFQNPIDRPYISKYGAVAVYTEECLKKEFFEEINTKDHPDPDLELMVIYKKDLMNFIHKLYERASKC